MNTMDMDRVVAKVATRRPELARATSVVADALTFGEGPSVIHQARVQYFLWWTLPRSYPDDLWNEAVEATGELLEELGMARLATIARSGATADVLAEWRKGVDHGPAAFRAAQARSGVEPPDTAALAWGSIMGMDEVGAHEEVERRLADAIESGEFTPGTAGWRTKAAALTEAALTRPLDLPPGQTLAGLVTTERVGTWTGTARHPTLAKWRAEIANRLLNPIEPPSDPGQAVAPMQWLLEKASDPAGAELTQSNYLARLTVIEATERFGWWNFEKPPRSESDIHQLIILREAAKRLGLVRRRGRRLHLTNQGRELLANPERLWERVATETEDDGQFTRMVTELVALRLLRSGAEARELASDIAPILAAQGWAVAGDPITADGVSYAVYRPLRWWRVFNVITETKTVWDKENPRTWTPPTIALTPAGERTVLAYLRARAAGPRSSIYDI
ncbi:MAG: hypothetical protein M0Z92_06385 [Actinomycetota bacterium]|nr:hypothetical protein [Actinomycetota bacterium]